MEYSKKTILDYNIGDIVYYLLNNNTIVQAKFTKLETVIYNRDHRLNFYTLFTLRLANGDIIENKPDCTKYIYASVNDVNEGVKMVTNSDLLKTEVYESKLKNILNKERIEFDLYGIYYYKAGATIKRYTFNKVMWINHKDFQYEYSVLTKGGTIKRTCNIDQCHINEVYLTKEEALHNSNVEVITFTNSTTPSPSSSRIFDLNDLVYFLHFDTIRCGKIIQVNTYKKFVNNEVTIEYSYCLQFKEDNETCTCFVSAVSNTKEELINNLKGK